MNRSEQQPSRDQVLAVVAEQLGVPPTQLQATRAYRERLCADPPDVVNFVMDLEEELGGFEPPRAALA